RGSRLRGAGARDERCPASPREPPLAERAILPGNAPRGSTAGCRPGCRRGNHGPLKRGVCSNALKLRSITLSLSARVLVSSVHRRSAYSWVLAQRLTGDCAADGAVVGCVVGLKPSSFIISRRL